MKFDIIATQEHSHADFSALLLFSSAYLAKHSTKAINDSEWANTQKLTRGESGAFQVGKYVMLNTYSKQAFENISKLVKSLPDTFPPCQEELKELWEDLWDSLNDDTEPYSVTREHALDYFKEAFPDATVETDPEFEHKFTLKYRGETFTCSLHHDEYDDRDSRIILYKGDTCKFPLDYSLERDNDTKAVKKIFDDSIDPVTHRVTPETAMFDLLKTIDFSKNLPKATERKLKGIANLFFQSWLKEAKFLFDVEETDEIDDNLHWLEVWFEYKGNKFHIDFFVEDGKNTLNLWTTNEYEENVDNTYVTVDNLQETIDSVTEDGHFPESSKEEPEDNWVFPNNIFMFDMAGTVKDAEDRFVEFIMRFPGISYESGIYDYTHGKDYDEITFYARYKGETISVTFRQEEGKVNVSLGTHRSIAISPVKDVDSLDKEIARFLRPEQKSLEERLDKVEHLIADLQHEVKEIKKKI